MTNDLLGFLTKTTVAGSVAALVVIVLRPLLRKSFGCGVAYAVWLLLPCCVVAVLLPKTSTSVPSLGIVSFAYNVVKTIPAPASTSALSVTWQEMLLVLWACGAASMASWQLHLQRAFVKELGSLRLEGEVARFEGISAGPALIGLWRPLIAVPVDFESRYTPIERDLIVAHERAHARNGLLPVSRTRA